MKKLLQIRDEYLGAEIEASDLYQEIEEIRDWPYPDLTAALWAKREQIVQKEQEIRRLRFMWSTLFSGFLRRIKGVG